jgi:hypothetical protein
MTMITPKSRPWAGGQTPLFNGLGVSRALRAGTFGVALARKDNGDVVATCARHVGGDASDGGTFELWTQQPGAGADWEATGAVDVLAPPEGMDDVYRGLDLAFLSPQGGVTAINDVFGLPLQTKASPAAVGTHARYRGCRNDWVNCVYQGPYSAAFVDAFGSLDVAGLATSALGVIGLDPTGYDPFAYEGDSGAAVSWKRPDGRVAFFGSLIGVSKSQPRGLILLLDVAFARIGLADYTIVGSL